MNVKKKFKKILNENSKITFEKIIENATDSSYEIGIITNTTNVQKSLSLRDNLGRNIPVNLDDSDYVFLDIETYRMEEKIYDCQKKERISFQEFIKNYCDKFKELKSIYTLNNS